MKRIVAILAASLLGVACANRPESIQASYVSPEKYANLDCPALEARMTGARVELAMHSETQNAKATGDAVSVFMVGIPVSKIEGDLEPEIAQLKGEMEAINTAMTRNKCGTDAARQVNSASAAAMAASAPAVLEAGSSPSRDAGAAPPPRWIAIDNAAELRAVYSDTTITGTAYARDGRGGVPFIGQFRRDGTGVLTINGENIPRIWHVKGNDQVCATDTQATNCYRLERNANKAGDMRGEDVDSGAKIRFKVERNARAD